MTKAIDTWHSNDRTIKSEEIAKVNFNSVCLSFSSIEIVTVTLASEVRSPNTFDETNSVHVRKLPRGTSGHTNKQQLLFPLGASRLTVAAVTANYQQLDTKKITSRSLACSRLSDHGEEEKEKGTRKVCGARKRKKVPPLRLSPVSSCFISALALSRFSRLNYLGAWNRLRDSRRSK